MDAQEKMFELAELNAEARRTKLLTENTEAIEIVDGWRGVAVAAEFELLIVKEKLMRSLT